MSKLAFKNGKLVHEYDDTKDEEKTEKEKVQKKRDTNIELNQIKDKLATKDFSTLSSKEKDELLYLLLKMHNIL